MVSSGLRLKQKTKKKTKKIHQKNCDGVVSPPRTRNEVIGSDAFDPEKKKKNCDGVVSPPEQETRLLALMPLTRKKEKKKKKLRWGSKPPQNKKRGYWL